MLKAVLGLQNGINILLLSSSYFPTPLLSFFGPAKLCPKPWGMPHWNYKNQTIVLLTSKIKIFAMLHSCENTFVRPLYTIFWHFGQKRPYIHSSTNLLKTSVVVGTIRCILESIPRKVMGAWNGYLIWGLIDFGCCWQNEQLPYYEGNKSFWNSWIKV